jgi:hypothetical protein
MWVSLGLIRRGASGLAAAVTLAVILLLAGEGYTSCGLELILVEFTFS